MIPQAHITAWREVAPWSDDAQIEQDLVLTRATIELFSAPNLVGKFAMRGGTALHKMFLSPAVRYSEDIDLVQVEASPIGASIDAIRESLDPWLGKPKRDMSEGNVSLTYRFESEIPPVRQLRLKIEINTREHFALLGHSKQNLAASNPWFTGQAEVVTFEIDELLSPKMRALHQRRKGRDLFDLWLTLEREMLNPQRVVDCFLEYMKREGHSVSRAEFEQNLHEKHGEADFMNDIRPLLRSEVTYDPVKALEMVQKALVALLPGDPWRGPSDQPARSVKKQTRKRR